jgi:hypothetical protein
MEGAANIFKLFLGFLCHVRPMARSIDAVYQCRLPWLLLIAVDPDDRL